MKDSYEDIIHRPYSGVTNRKRMSMINRGAQFSPFATLTGYDAAIRETGRLTASYIDLDIDGTAEVDKKLRQLQQHQEEAPEITVTYFVPDEWKCGGAYVRVTGRVRRVDQYEQAILMGDGRLIYFSKIYHISGDIFSEI